MQVRLSKRLMIVASLIFTCCLCCVCGSAVSVFSPPATPAPQPEIGVTFAAPVVRETAGAEQTAAEHRAPTAAPAQAAVVEPPTAPAATAPAATAPAATAPEEPTPWIASDVAGMEVATVTRVIDGDTIEVNLDGYQRVVRYIGVDTPETVRPGSPVECFGREASARNREIVADRLVWLERDVSETDRYGRLLRYVYVEDAGALRMVNEMLTAEGYAQVATYPPDVRWQERLLNAQRRAREAGLGLWGACAVAQPAPQQPAPQQPAPQQPAPQQPEPPASTGGCPQGCAQPAPGCDIKGNISRSTGEKIYHLPGQRNYDETIIEPEKGERWFCSEAEAQANGWRRAKR